MVLLLLTTTTGTTWCKKALESSYSESLAVHRKLFYTAHASVRKPTQPKNKKKPIYITPISAITDQLDLLLACKKAANERVKYIHGYTIQLYTGSSRDDAFKIRNKIYKYYPEITPEVIYDVPNYTVKIGKFLDKLEAYFMYGTIRKRVPQAIIRPIAFANQAHLFINKQKGVQANISFSVPPAPEHPTSEQE